MPQQPNPATTAAVPGAARQRRSLVQLAALLPLMLVIVCGLMVSGCATPAVQQQGSPESDRIGIEQPPAERPKSQPLAGRQASAREASDRAMTEEPVETFFNRDDIDELARRFARLRPSPETIQSDIAANRAKVIEKYHKLLLTPREVQAIDLRSMRPGQRRRYLELIYWSDKSTKRTFAVKFVKRNADTYLYRLQQDGESQVFELRTNHRSQTLQDSLLANINAYLAAEQTNRDRFSEHACEFVLSSCRYQWLTGVDDDAGVTVQVTGRFAHYTWIQELKVTGGGNYQVESVFDKQGLLLHRTVKPLGSDKKFIAKEWVRIE